MAPADAVQLHDADDAPGSSSLFRDVRIWIAQRVPLRSTFIETVRANGGRVVPLEKMADILIADHLRKDCPPNSFSYTWIEQSVAKGVLQDKENHRAGPSANAVRPVGALRPAKGTRLLYSEEDDRVLYDWVMDNERKGERILGNEIYKQLEQKNPRHPWQSWRDRWIKYVSQRPAPAASARDTARRSSSDDDATDPQATDIAPAQSPPRKTSKVTDKDTEVPLQQSRAPATRPRSSLPPEDSQTSIAMVPEKLVPVKLTTSTHRQEVPSSEAEIDRILRIKPSKPHFRKFGRLSNGQRISQTRRSSTEDGPTPVPVTEEEHATFFEILLQEAESIESVPVGRYEEAWTAWAETNPEHTSEDWRIYYESRVLPYFQASRASNGETEVVDTEHQNEESHPAPSPPVRANVASPRVSLDHVPPLPHEPESTKDLKKTNDTMISPRPASTPSKRMVPVVVIPSPSSQKMVDFADIPPRTQAARSNPGSPDGDSRKRKRATTSEVSNHLPMERQEISKKRQRLDDTVAESPQRASLALANALGENIKTAPGAAVQVMNVIDVEDNDDDNERDGNVTHDLMRGTERSAPKSETAFDVYESHEIPEGEEENVILKENGSPEFPTPHHHARSEEALVVFGDPPTDFFLAPTQTDFVIAPTHASSQDSWHDLQDYGDVAQDDGADQLQSDLAAESAMMKPIGRNSREILDSALVEPRSIDRIGVASHHSLDGGAENAYFSTELPSVTIGLARIREIENARRAHGANAAKKRVAKEFDQGTHYVHGADLVNLVDDDSLFLPQEAGLSQVGEASEDEEEDTFMISHKISYPAAVTLDSDAILPDVDATFSTPQGAEVIAIESDDDDDITSLRPPSEERYEDQNIPWPVSEELEGLSEDGIDRPNMLPTQSLPQDRLDTQALLDSEVGDFDIEVPPPPESDIEEMDNDEAFALAQPDLAHYLDTQAILAADTQQLELDEAPPDFNIQDDEDFVRKAYLNDEPAAPAFYASRSRETSPVRQSSQISPWPSSPPARPSAPPKSPPRFTNRHSNTNQHLHNAPKVPSPPEDPEDAFIARHRALGSSEHDVLYALYCTTWNSRLAAQVLQSLRQGREMPRGVPGIWSEEEDAVLKGGDARHMKLLEVRHGKRAFEERVRLLEEYATA